MLSVEAEILRAKDLQKETLHLGNRNLSIIPPTIGDLVQLKRLFLHQNQLRTLPKEIGHLINLELLEVSSNFLEELPDEMRHLHKLEELFLNNNEFRNLPPVLGSLAKLKKLSFGENTIESPPPEIISRGFPAIKSFLASLDGSSDTRRIFEGKLLIVGQGGVGKTSICNRLTNNTFSEHEEKTNGIAIRRWPLKSSTGRSTKIEVNLWDFGGQEIYHSTHQFFLTNRSAYMLVWDARQEASYGKIEYWLHTIESYGGNSPIILVINKCDEHISEINLKDLKEKFPQIGGLFKVSCKHPERGIDTIESLRRRLVEVMRELPFMGAMWPDSWFEIRRKLEARARKKRFIAFSEFKELCESRGISGIDVTIFAQYLHDLGVVLHFHNDSRLRDIVILRPEWATNAVYDVLGDREIRLRQGLVLSSDFARIWESNRDYPAGLYDAIARIMINFQLAFPISNQQDSLLVAELLPAEGMHCELDGSTGSELDASTEIKFIYTFSFLPAGLVPRLIVSLYTYIDSGADGTFFCWRHGALLRRVRPTARGTKAEVALLRERNFDNLIEIRVRGEGARDFLAVIRNYLDLIISGIKKVSVSRLIPCRCRDGCGQLYDYDALLRKEQRGVKLVNCDESASDVPVSRLLDGIDARKYDERNAQQGGFPAMNIDNRGGRIVTENYNISGQAGVVGSRSTIVQSKISQKMVNCFREANTKTLLKELEDLREALRSAASTPEEFNDLACVAKSESDLKSGNVEAAAEGLSKVGKWVLATADKIGVSVVSKLLTSLMGIDN